jgi:ParB family chromosome partitioning protein
MARPSIHRKPMTPAQRQARRRKLLRTRAKQAAVEWYTPPEFIERARAVLGEIDLDPATCAKAQGNVRATRYFTAEDDGLAHEWHGRVFLNPPFARMAAFVEKLLAEIDAGRVFAAILLTNSNTSSTWFHRVAEDSSAICLMRGRIRFERSDRSNEQPMFSQAFLYFGPKVEKFREVFADVGLVFSVIS